MKIMALYVIAAFLLNSCMLNTGKEERETKRSNLQNETVKHGKPSNKDVILMVIQNSDVLLNVDSSCSGVGSEANDKTIGQFLSSFWQYHTDSTARNSLQINVAEAEDNEIKEKHWKATFMINGQTENENWSWGVSFYVLDKNWLVIRKSFRCLGGG